MSPAEPRVSAEGPPLASTSLSPCVGIVTLWLSAPPGGVVWALLCSVRMSTLLCKQSLGSLLDKVYACPVFQKCCQVLFWEQLSLPHPNDPISEALALLCWHRAGNARSAWHGSGYLVLLLCLCMVLLRCFQEWEMAAKFPFREYSGFAHLKGRGVRPKVLQQLRSHSGGCCNP